MTTQAGTIQDFSWKSDIIATYVSSEKLQTTEIKRCKNVLYYLHINGLCTERQTDKHTHTHTWSSLSQISVEQCLNLSISIFYQSYKQTFSWTHGIEVFFVLRRNKLKFCALRSALYRGIESSKSCILSVLNPDGAAVVPVWKPLSWLSSGQCTRWDLRL